jgi:hypothetical protein
MLEVPTVPRKRNRPWASGAAEILQHGINLLQKDTDTNRRLAMLSIDNAVELMIKTYLGLPRRANGLKISRKELDEIYESFPNLLDALEKHCTTKLEGVELADIDWYHRLRNELYHQGIGLTVERDKVVVYAETAQLLFSRLFGFDIEIEKPSGTDTVGRFITAWSNLYRVLESLAKAKSPEQKFRGTNAIIPELSAEGYLDRDTVEEIRRIRKVRNNVVHGNISELSEKLIAQLNRITEQLQQQLEGMASDVP